LIYLLVVTTAVFFGEHNSPAISKGTNGGHKTSPFLHPSVSLATTYREEVLTLKDSHHTSQRVWSNGGFELTTL
jgi:hypothetical protein